MSSVLMEDRTVRCEREKKKEIHGRPETEVGASAG
jgi:hypothetical protein